MIQEKILELWKK